MNALEPVVTLMGTLAASFAVGLFIQWLTLHALLHVLPGRRRLSVAQVAVQRTRTVMIPPRVTPASGR
jgi:hypothetical protein